MTPRQSEPQEPTSPRPSKAARVPGGQVITDARAMRALAHPVRVALLEAIRRDGDMTATRAAELLGESPGNMSWHLQTLAKYGFVEESGAGRGRSRPWRLTSASRSFETGMGDPETATAGEALERTLFERMAEQLREWWSQRMGYPRKWRRASFVFDSIAYVTPDELTAVMEDVAVIYRRYNDRNDPAQRPKDARPVRLYAHGHPLAPTPAGN